MTKVDALVPQWREKSERLKREIRSTPALWKAKAFEDCADELEAARAADRADALPRNSESRSPDGDGPNIVGASPAGDLVQRPMMTSVETGQDLWTYLCDSGAGSEPADSLSLRADALHEKDLSMRDDIRLFERALQRAHDSLEGAGALDRAHDLNQSWIHFKKLLQAELADALVPSSEQDEADSGARGKGNQSPRTGSTASENEPSPSIAPEWVTAMRYAMVAVAMNYGVRARCRESLGLGPDVLSHEVLEARETGASACCMASLRVLATVFPQYADELAFIEGRDDDADDPCEATAVVQGAIQSGDRQTRESVSSRSQGARISPDAVGRRASTMGGVDDSASCQETEKPPSANAVDPTAAHQAPPSTREKP